MSMWGTHRRNSTNILHVIMDILSKPRSMYHPCIIVLILITDYGATHVAALLPSPGRCLGRASISTGLIVDQSYSQAGFQLRVQVQWLAGLWISYKKGFKVSSYTRNSCEICMNFM